MTTSKILPHMIVSIASLTGSRGQFLGKAGLPLISLSQLPMMSIAWSTVSMLVYIESVLAVKSLAFDGRRPVMFGLKSMAVLVSLMYVFTKGVNIQRQQSNQQLQMFVNVPMQHTIGLVLKCNLCTFIDIWNFANLSSGFRFLAVCRQSLLPFLSVQWNVEIQHS